MGRYKIQREDVIRKKEFERLLKKAEPNLPDGRVEIKTDLPFKVRIQSEKLKCLLCLLYLFGKRISEVLKLKRKDIHWDDQYLYVKFYILKRKPEKGMTVRREKQIARRIKYTQLIIDYVQTIEGSREWLFPGKCGKRRYTRDYRKKNGTLVTYIYTQDDVGRMSAEYIWKILNLLSKSVSGHRFRTALATRMAERDVTVPKLMKWFDWVDPRTAMGYVELGKKEIEELGDQEW